MEQETLTAVRDMLTRRKVLCLAAVIDEEPAASLLPFAVAPDFLGLYVQASTLARHSRALQEGAIVALLIHELDTDEVDPLQVARLSFLARVHVLPRDTDEFAAASAVFVARLPSAEVTLSFADFGLYRLQFTAGRYVAGFAQAYDVGSEDLEALASLAG